MDSLGNVQARYKLLKDALQGSKKVPSALLKACKSQGGLAKLDLPAEGITPMALNTLKSKADVVIENGGWEELNQMRQSYLAAKQGGDSKPCATRNRATDAASKLKGAEDALENERKYRIQLEVAYEALLNRMRSSAVDDEDLAQFINRHVTGFSFKRLSVVTT
ncbi:hypothetical protein [Comamonas testosteroni]|uniref:hypothetical protein n=1 Tax=Comamonas testosteroni TaxID=285 RepID=UPI0026EE65CF|nr:hypothetical protein [Comamonas testosteroni]